jgi:hypothetical protein
MATKSIARRKTTAYVHNPSGGRALTVGGRRKNAAAKRSTKKVVARKTTKRRRNPVVSVVSKRQRNPRRLSNPMSGIGQLLSTALFASAGVVLFDFVTSKVLPVGVSAPIRIAVKAGAGLAVAHFGKSLPVVGAYSKEIGLVLVTLAGVDALQTYVLPMIPSIGGSPMPAALSPGDELSGSWVNAYVPDEDDDEYEEGDNEY